MLRNYFMASIDTSQLLGVEIYQYKIKNHGASSNNWIPIIVLDVPFDNANLPEQILINDSRKIIGSDIGINSIPVWAYNETNTLVNCYLETYVDDYFSLYTNIDSERITFTIVFKDSNGNSLFNVKRNIYKASAESISLIMWGIKTTDNYYYYYGDKNSGTSISTTISNNNVRSIVELPTENESKGILDTSNITITYTIGDIFKDSKTTRFRELLKVSTPYNPNNPYPNTGDDPDDPPDGNFDYTPDPIDIPDLPTTSVTDSGLVSLYAPTEAQLKALASFLWSDAFSLDTFKKMFNNPMDCILGLTILPINVPHGSAKEITVGNIVSTVSCDTLPTQYTSLDCGTFEFKQSAFTGSYLDFSPYTKCYVYLPFIGCQEIDIDEFMGSTMGVVYHIDILTGALFCYVTRNDSVIYTYAGCCAENVPLSSNDFSTTVGSIMQIGIAAAGAVATIASAGAATPATAAAATTLQAKTAAGVTAAGITGASAVMNSKPSVAHSGSLGGGGGMMGVMYPYLIFIAPRASIPYDQNKYTGFPANKIVKISSLSGFNVIEAVNLEVKGANDSEMSEIDQYLKAGVII